MSKQSTALEEIDWEMLYPTRPDLKEVCSPITQHEIIPLSDSGPIMEIWDQNGIN